MALNNSGVSQVTSANADISVANGTTSPQLTLNSGTSVNQIVKLDNAGKLPSIDGSQLSNISSNSDVVYLNVQNLQQSIAILELQALHSLTPSDYDTMFLDIASDSSGYDNTIDTGAATTATFQTDKYINTNAAPAGSLVEWWNFNDNTGAGELGALNWSKTGTITAVSGLVGNSCKVNNADVNSNYFSRSRFLDVSQYQSGSWCFWCKQAELGKKIGGRGVQSSTTDWLIYSNVDGSIQVYIADSMQNTATGLISAGTWFHLALTWDASNTYFYVNGSLKLTWSGHRIFNTSGTDYIFRTYHSDNQTQTMEFDEMCFYSRNLSSTEINAIYNGGSGISSSGTAADKIVQTNTITLPANITAFQIYCKKAVAGSGSMNYQISLDGGSSFSSDKNLDTKYTNATSGTSLKLKLKLNGTGSGNTCHLYNYALMVWY